MDILILITNPAAGGIAASLAAACKRAGSEWAVFLTNDGVKVLSENTVVNALKQADSAIVCQDSWGLHMAGVECPLELGSQTSNSGLVSLAKQIVSL
ncbi:MAG: hypothetical protein GY703_14160 [Gammaproteobacteria bacterium]|nr:hypothetical protein [Gammaproteobacteria bacterium]